MPTIYFWMQPIEVTQSRYNQLIQRTGYFATPTRKPDDGVSKNAPIGKYDLRAAKNLALPLPRVMSTVTTFQSGHGWTASNALANGMNDNTDFALGAQSAFITSKTDTTAATLTKTGLTLDMSATKQLRVLVKMTGGDNVAGCSMYVSSDNFVANFCYVNIQNVTNDPTVRWLKDGEWKWITVNVGGAGAAQTTGSPNFAAIDSLRFRVTSQSGTSTTLRVNAVQVVERKSFAANGVVCFTYDDSYRNQYTVAKPHLDKYGYPGTAYTITSNVKDGNAGNNNWLTTDMLKNMRRYSGWEISLHCNTLANHARAFCSGTNARLGTTYGDNPLSLNELDEDITDNFEFLADNGLTDGYVGHCYPQGRFNTAVRDLMKRRVMYARAMTGNSNACETIPPADPYAIRSYTCDNTTSLASVQAIVDGIATHGGLAVFTIHDLVASPSTSTQFNSSTHASLVDYCAGKSGLRVMTLGDVMRQLNN